MPIDDLKLGELKQLVAFLTGLSGGQSAASLDGAWEIGKIYLIRTVTMIDTGRLVAVTPYELVLEEAAWIADTGRFTQAIQKAEFGEVEPFPDGRVIIGRGSIVDACEIERTQRSQK